MNINDTNQNTPEGLRTTAQIAALLNAAPRTVTNWRQSGVIPFVRIGSRTIRFWYPDVVQALRRRSPKF